MCTSSKSEGLIERVNELLSRITIDDSQLVKIFNETIRQLVHGLDMHKNDPNSFDLQKCDFMMLDSGVAKTPTGRERGIFYGIDMGGSNIRAVRVALEGDGVVKSVSERSMSLLEVPYAQHLSRGVLDKHATATELFDGVVHAIKLLMEEYGEAGIESRAQNAQIIPVGFTCSFGINQRGMNSAILTQWSKEIETGTAVEDVAEQVVGKDVMALTNEAFKRHNIHAEMNCILNDTVSTLITGAFELAPETTTTTTTTTTSTQSNSGPCNVGVVIGTGFNICYYEPKACIFNYEGKVINIECGGLKHSYPRIAADALVDFHSTNPGHQFAEKAVSGLYLGEAIRWILIEVLQNRAPDCLYRRDLIKTEQGAAIFNAEASQTAELMKSWLGSDDPLLASVVKAVCDAVFYRSARLAGAIMSAVIAKTEHDANGNVRVGLDGSVYVKNPKYQREVARVVNVLMQDTNVELSIVKGGSGIGAALLAACTAH